MMPFHYAIMQIKENGYLYKLYSPNSFFTTMDSTYFLSWFFNFHTLKENSNFVIEKSNIFYTYKTFTVIKPYIYNKLLYPSSFIILSFHSPFPRFVDPAKCWKPNI